MSDDSDRDEMVVAAKNALANAYAPYSRFPVGAALRFADGTVVSAANIENASYGLSLCAETVAVAKAMDGGHRGGLEAIAVYSEGAQPAMPCGRCRQVLWELASLGGTDPEVWCASGGGEVIRSRLSRLLPEAFGPDIMKQEP